MNRPEIILYDAENKVVLIPNIIFMNKQNIDWKQVESFLKQFVGEVVLVTETEDIVFLGNDFPNEYAGSRYTRSAKGARAKAKADAVQGVREMVKIASERSFRENHKEKHSSSAGNGWYYYTIRFALPVYENNIKTDTYNVYSGCLVVNCTSSGKKYLYDLVDIKKEASNPFKAYK